MILDRPHHLLLPALIWCVLATSGARAQTLLYVDDDAALGGDGASWETAYKYLQDALIGAVGGTEIRVAQGTYKPDQDEGGNVTSGDREGTFQLITGVGLYGGYRGCPGGDCGGGDPDQRNIDLYETTLRGDLLGDDSPDPYPKPWADPTRDDNSYHVVTGSFTDSTAVLNGFTITAGHANGPFPHSAGGGMHNHTGDPTVIHCTFIENAAPGHPFIVGYGGGMFNWNSSPMVVHCTFSENLAMGGLPDGVGGGMYNAGGSPTVSHSVFRGNHANFGGGVTNDGSDATLTNCTFVANWSGMYNTQCNPTVANCTFTKNGPYAGGVIGGGTFTHCIVWGNASGQFLSDLAIVLYSCVQGGFPGDGNIDADPLFVDADGPDGVPGTEDDNLRLSPGSPCINAGDPGFIAEPGETDLDGHARVLCSRVDMGAYEFGISDFDCDQVVDLTDFANWESCFTGPAAGPYPEGCEALDFDYDGDVDLQDFGGFQQVFE